MSRHMQSTVAKFRLLFPLVAALAAGCGSGQLVSEYSQLPESFLKAVQTGELTSKEDLTGLSGLASGAYKKYPVSPFAEDDDFEFPSASVVGKIVGFRLLSDQPFERNLEGQKQAEANLCSAMELARSGEDRAQAAPLQIGDIRYVNFRKNDDGSCSWNEVRGMRLLTYSLETTNDFFKIAFVVDRNSMWMIDLHK